MISCVHGSHLQPSSDAAAAADGNTSAAMFFPAEVAAVQAALSKTNPAAESLLANNLQSVGAFCTGVGNILPNFTCTAA